MNILVTLTWPADAPETPGAFYRRLRFSVARGARFPLNSPYEVGLIHPRGQPSAPEQVAVLVMQVASQTAGETPCLAPQIEEWFSKCCPGGIAAGAVTTTRPATRLKLTAELDPDFDVAQSFGTFVGEPDDVVASAPADDHADHPAVDPAAPAASASAAAPEAADAAPTAADPLAHPSAAQEAAQPISSDPMPASLQAAPPAEPAVATPPVIPPPTAKTPSTSCLEEGLQTCLGPTLIGSGVLLAFISLAFGGLVALGQFAGDAPTEGLTEFWIFMLCCPLPFCLGGLLLAALGIFLPRWLKQSQSLPVKPL